MYGYLEPGERRLPGHPDALVLGLPASDEFEGG
jgi:hypothetical protein